MLLTNFCCILHDLHGRICAFSTSITYNCIWFHKIASLACAIEISGWHITKISPNDVAHSNETNWRQGDVVFSTLGLILTKRQLCLTGTLLPWKAVLTKYEICRSQCGSDIWTFEYLLMKTCQSKRSNIVLILIIFSKSGSTSPPAVVKKLTFFTSNPFELRPIIDYDEPRRSWY